MAQNFRNVERIIYVAIIFVALYIATYRLPQLCPTLQEQKPSVLSWGLANFSTSTQKNDSSRDLPSTASAYKNPYFAGGFTVDILSVASLERQSLLISQRRTFGSHPSVRNFFNVSEADDADPLCYKELTAKQVIKISNFCRSGRQKLNFPLKQLRGIYAKKQRLQERFNMVGWLCAQQRPYAGYKKVYSHYQKMGEKLPDYFIVLDDDSYYDMEAFTLNHKHENSTIPKVAAGCLYRTKSVKMSFPHGGFGTIISNGSLEYLFHPIWCGKDAEHVEGGRLNPVDNGTRHNHPNAQAICTQLSRNTVGELPYFYNGTSLVNLIYDYVNSERYRDIDQWTSGFCMHSDWAIGYFVNFYNVSIHVAEKFYENVPHERMFAYQNSVIHHGKRSGFCKFNRICPSGVEICHGFTEDWIKNEYEKLVSHT